MRVKWFCDRCGEIPERQVNKTDAKRHDVYYHIYCGRLVTREVGKQKRLDEYEK